MPVSARCARPSRCAEPTPGYGAPHGRGAVVRHPGRAVPRWPGGRARRARPGRGRRRAGRRAQRLAGAAGRRRARPPTGRARRRACARALHHRRDAVGRRATRRHPRAGPCRATSRSCRSTRPPTRATAGTTTARSSARASTAIRGRSRSRPRSAMPRIRRARISAPSGIGTTRCTSSGTCDPTRRCCCACATGELDLGGRRCPSARVRLPARMVLLGRGGPRLLHRARALPGRVGVARVPPPPRGRARLGARHMTRVRNFSDWAYWRLHLETVVESDPCPVDDPRRLRRVARAHPRAPPRSARSGSDRRRARDRSHGVRRLRYRTVAIASSSTPKRPWRCPRTCSCRTIACVPGSAVLAIHGHGPGKAMLCGIEAGGPGDDYAHQLARMGHLVLAPDLRGFGERADCRAGGQVPLRLEPRLRDDGRRRPARAEPVGPPVCARSPHRAPARRARSHRRGRALVRRHVLAVPRRDRWARRGRDRVRLPVVVVGCPHRPVEHVRFAGAPRSARRDRAPRPRRARWRRARCSSSREPRT